MQRTRIVVLRRATQISGEQRAQHAAKSRQDAGATSRRADYGAQTGVFVLLETYSVWVRSWIWVSRAWLY